MEQKKKRGIKPGTKFSAEHCKAISEGRKRIDQRGEKNPNYKADRSKIGVRVTSIRVPADISEWLNQQPNKSQYVAGLIREDMKKRNNNL